MTKQCQNEECKAFIEDNDPFCKICGVRQPEPKKKKAFNFMKRKDEQPIIQGSIASPSQFEDFRLARPMALQQPKKDETQERLVSIENKLNVMLKNHEWLLMSVDAWLQGYRQKEEEQEEESESNK
jgi:hypothetical protein